MTDLTGKNVAFAVAKEGIEQVEVTSPWEAQSRTQAGSPCSCP